MGYRYHDLRRITAPLSAKEQQRLVDYGFDEVTTHRAFVYYFFGSPLQSSDTIVLLHKQFDAILQLDSYGTFRLAFALEANSLKAEEVAPYLYQDSGYSSTAVSVYERNGRQVVELMHERAAPSYYEEGADHLTKLLPIYEELSLGDLRSLYLFWLAVFPDGSLPEGMREPPVPAGLSMDELEEHHRALCRQVGISDGALLAAAQRSPSKKPPTQCVEDIIDALDESQLRAYLKDVAQGRHTRVVHQLKSSVAEARERRFAPGRDASTLAADIEEGRREAQRRAERARLDQLEADWEKLWQRVEDALSVSHPRYKKPVATLEKLAEVAHIRGHEDEFDERFERLLDLYGDSPTFQKYLRAKSLL